MTNELTDSVESIDHSVFTDSVVSTTTDYYLFKPLKGNRDVNILHKRRLLESIRKNYLFTVIVVNENFEVIDGQHRFECIAELNLPLHYITCKGYGLKEVQILNINTKNWSSDDYLQGYIDLGVGVYAEFKEFRTKYKLNHMSAMSILSFNDQSSLTIGDFRNGKMNIKDMDASVEFISKLNRIGQYYDGILRRTFIACMIRLRNNQHFDFDVFMNKLKLQPYSLQDCTSVENYLILIENIYNFKNRNKINLRF